MNNTADKTPADNDDNEIEYSVIEKANNMLMDVALRMLKRNVDIKMIIEATGCSKEELQKIKAKI